MTIQDRVGLDKYAFYRCDVSIYRDQKQHSFRYCDVSVARICTASVTLPGNITA
jgi:hypothetical protein